MSSRSWRLLAAVGLLLLTIVASFFWSGWLEQRQKPQSSAPALIDLPAPGTTPPPAVKAIRAYLATGKVPAGSQLAGKDPTVVCTGEECAAAQDGLIALGADKQEALQSLNYGLSAASSGPSSSPPVE